jgi:hypothetical protein
MVVTIKIKGVEHYAGTIEPSDEKGFWFWTLYDDSSISGIETSKREARKILIQQAKRVLTNK